jgi:hypothetical protein
MSNVPLPPARVAQLERAVKAAAYLVAALAARRAALSEEVRDGLDLLRDELDSVGALAPYQTPKGTLRIWQPPGGYERYVKDPGQGEQDVEYRLCVERGR